MMTSSFFTFNPLNGESVASFANVSAAEIQTICLRAQLAFENYKKFSVQQRASALFEIVSLLKRNKKELARLESLDTGKPPSVAEQEVEGALALWEYAAALARTDQSAHFSLGMSGSAFTVRVPMGAVGMIVPWNYPLITVSERMPFALAAGCSVVLKPSELAVGSLQKLIEIIGQSGALPEGTVQILFGQGDAAGRALVEDQNIDMISFVGSTRVGRLIESAAASLGKRVTAELGGNNFVFVYRDADVERAAQNIVASAFRNAGQACVAGAHVLVEPEAAQRLDEAISGCLKKEFSQERPLQPMITLAQKQRIEALIKSAVAEDLVPLEGSIVHGDGNHVGPVVFNNVPISSILFKEEIFGPILTITPMQADDFVRTAHSTGYGLAGYLWTSSAETVRRVVSELKVGRIWVNSNSDAWLPELPVGGFGASGIGRETGACALDTYSLPKAVMCS